MFDRLEELVSKLEQIMNELSDPAVVNDQARFKKLMKEQAAKNIQGGLHMVKFTDLQCSNLFIDKKLGCEPLHVEEDDIDRAIGDSIKLCVDVLDGKAKVVGMKGE